MLENAFLDCRTSLFKTLQLGLYPPLATGTCESCQHIKEKKDHVLGGANTAFLLQLGEEAKELGGQ